MDIGFIGLGNMGGPMARRLIEAGHKLIVYDTRNDAVAPLVEKLTRFDIAFGVINDLNFLARHPHLRRTTVGTPTGPASMPAPAAIHDGVPRSYGAVPALGEHTAMVRAEFCSKKV